MFSYLFVLTRCPIHIFNDSVRIIGNKFIEEFWIMEEKISALHVNWRQQQGKMIILSYNLEDCFATICCTFDKYTRKAYVVMDLKIVCFNQ